MGKQLCVTMTRMKVLYYIKVLETKRGCHFAWQKGQGKLSQCSTFIVYKDGARDNITIL